MDGFLRKREFEDVEKQLLFQLDEEESDIDILMKLAMVRLQFPFEDEISSIKYLDRIIDIDKYNFNAIVIKLYLQNYYYHEYDKDIENILKRYKENHYYVAIAYYIISWKYHRVDETKERYWLEESIKMDPGMVNPYIQIGQNYYEKEQFEKAKKYYSVAVRNVKSTEFSEYDAIDPKAFIDEYITGIKLSKYNYDHLQTTIKKLDFIG